MTIDSFTGVNNFLSNFYRARITFEGREYKTVEHAYQAAKTLNEEERENIAKAQTPSQAKRLGQEVRLREGWEEIKLGIMTELVGKKFENKILRFKLSATGNQELVEGNYWGDTYWGICRGIGRNHLGKILMEVRKEIE